MNCPFCNKNELKVLESRESSEIKTRRRRECLNCNGRFTTYEIIESTYPRIVKKNGGVETFNKEKILLGITKSCEKRPVTAEKIAKIVNQIENEIRQRGKKDIKSSIIGNIVMNKLKKVDKVAYIRFASVYKDFQDIDSFKEEIKKIS